MSKGGHSGKSGGGGAANNQNESVGRGLKNFKSEYLIPQINNPANIPNNAMTEDEFLRFRGVGNSVSGAGIDRIGGANMTVLSVRQREKSDKEIVAQMGNYYQRRQAAKEEYKQLVASGVIRDKTRIEKIITTAHGHTDLPSVQAARRMADKLGIDWKTGKKKKKLK